MKITVNMQTIQEVSENSKLEEFRDLIDEYRYLNRYEYLDKLYKQWVKDDFNKNAEFKLVNDRLREIRCIFIDNNIKPKDYK